MGMVFKERKTSPEAINMVVKHVITTENKVRQPAAPKSNGKTYKDFKINRTIVVAKEEISAAKKTRVKLR